MPSSYVDVRPHYDRRPGPAPMAAGDGLEGIYTGVLHTTPSGGTCKVVIPALGLTRTRTANVPPYLTGVAGDACVVAFDEEKEPWVVSTQTLSNGPWITPTLISPWAAVSGDPIQYMKDAQGFVHFRGRIGTLGTQGSGAVNMPVGYRPYVNAQQLYGCGYYNGSTSAVPPYVAFNTAASPSNSVLAVFYPVTVSQIWLSGVSYLAEA